MRKIDIFAAALILATAFSNIVLLLFGESRPDVYISITILIYYIFYSILAVGERRGYKAITYLNITLFIIFSLIVGYRIYEILYM